MAHLTKSVNKPFVISNVLSHRSVSHFGEKQSSICSVCEVEALFTRKSTKMITIRQFNCSWQIPNSTKHGWVVEIVKRRWHDLHIMLSFCPLSTTNEQKPFPWISPDRTKHILNLCFRFVTMYCKIFVEKCQFKKSELMKTGVRLGLSMCSFKMLNKIRQEIYIHKMLQP
jgi:hypothetical protein